MHKFAIPKKGSKEEIVSTNPDTLSLTKAKVEYSTVQRGKDAVKLAIKMEDMKAFELHGTSSPTKPGHHEIKLSWPK